MLTANPRAAAVYLDARGVTSVDTERPQGGTPIASWARETAMNEPLAAVTRMASLRAALFDTKVDPQRIARFVLVDVLGAGGMGMVYAAYDPALDRRVALKLVRSELHSDRHGERRALREAKAMASLSHPNVVQLYEAGVWQGRLFLAMELVKGTTLSAWLRAERRSWSAILRRFVAAGRGLAAAHAAGFVHGDFKPDNVLVGADERVRVTDFGLARRLRGDEEGRTAGQSAQLLPAGEISATSTGALAGTPLYMAPEQFCGERASAASDQFSFCVALFRALYGVHPFPGDKSVELARAVLEGRIRKFPRSAVPRRIRHVLARGLARAPEARFPSMDALLSATESRPLGRALVGLAGVGGLVAALGAGTLLRDPCETSANALEDGWKARRAQVELAYRSSGLPAADRLWATVAPMLDNYVESAGARQSQICREHSDGVISSRLSDLQRACLQRRLDVVEGVAEGLVEGTPDALRAGPRAVASLDELAACDDAKALLLGVESPRVEQEAELRTLSRALASARARELLGDLAGAAEELDARLLPRAHALGYAPAIAEALYQRGRLAVLSREFTAARELLRRSMALAIRARHDSLVTEIRTWQVQARLESPDPADDIPALLAEAAAWLDRSDATPLQRADYELTRSFALQRIGEPREAEEASRRAYELRARVLGADHLSAAIAMMNHGQHLAELGDTDTAVTELRAAYATIRACVGDEHMLTVDGRYNLAVTLLELADEAARVEAIRLLEGAARTTGLLRGAESLELADAQLGLAQAAVLADDVDAAAKPLREALGIYQRHPEHMLRAYALSLQGVIAFKQGRLEESLAAHRQALEAFKAGGVKDDAAREDVNIAGVLVKMNQPRLAEHHYRSAIMGLELALGPDAPALDLPRAELGRLLLALDEPPCAALKLLRRGGDAADAEDLTRATSRCSIERGLIVSR